MVIDSKGNMFEERRKEDRRKINTEEKEKGKNQRKKCDRRSSKNNYKP